MIRIVSWNIAKRWAPWRELAEMARRGEADVALLQETGSPPGDMVHALHYEDDIFWNRQLFDRWPHVVRLSDRVEVESFRQIPPISELGEHDIAVSGIGTIGGRQGGAARPAEGRSVHRGLHVCAVHEASPVDRHIMERRRARRIGASYPLGYLGLHRPRGTRPGTASSQPAI